MSDKLPPLDWPLIYRDRVYEIPNDTAVFRKNFKGGSFADKKSSIPSAWVEDGPPIYGVMATTKLLPDLRTQQQDEDNNETNNLPPVPGCPTSGTVTLIVAGIVSCGCAQDSIGTISINGTHTLTWNSMDLQFELNGVGSYSIQAYSAGGGCSTPSGDPVTGVWNITASCSGGKWTVTIFDPDGFSTDAFRTTTTQFASTSINNSAVCGDIAEDIFGGGTSTVFA